MIHMAVTVSQTADPDEVVHSPAKRSQKDDALL